MSKTIIQKKSPKKSGVKTRSPTPPARARTPAKDGTDKDDNVWDEEGRIVFSLPSADFGAPVAFTRYLYEKTEVLHSLLFALLDKQRDEALFWAYELYYSGCEDELVGWIQWVYNTFYASVDVWFCNFLEINLSRLMTLRDKTERDCLIGTIISNFVHREYDIQYFAKTYMKIAFTETKPAIRNHRIYIQFRPRDLAPYETACVRTSECDIGACSGSRIHRRGFILVGEWCKGRAIELLHKNTEARNSHRCSCYPRNATTGACCGLREVSRFPIRKNESLFLQTYVQSSYEAGALIDTAKPYLYHWLYFASHTPVWKQRILAYPSARINHETQMVEFHDDDDTEAFYQEYGYYPDEQSEEIHWIHGVELEPGHFQPLNPSLFLSAYSRGKIIFTEEDSSS
jgi:hypothetical protein